MGSNFVSYDWAANRLNKSKRMIHNYIKDGLLTRYRSENESVLRQDEVEQLHVELQSNNKTITRKTVILLEQRVKRLEDEMNAVKHILEIRDNPLRPSVQEAAGLRSASINALGRGTWKLEELSLWADQFERIDEITLDAFAKAAPGEPKPWAEFYNLCLAMMAFVENQRGLESAAIWKRLDEGRKKLRSTVLIWVELGRGSVPDQVFDLVDTSKERVIRRLASG